MEWAHILFATLAAFRLTTLFVSDAIWKPIRSRFPQVPWHCALCMSVWAGIAATVFLIALPWANWPLGLSWLYLAYTQTRALNTKIHGADMTPEQTAAIRQQANIDFLNKVWEVTAQLGMGQTADAAQAKAELAEAKARIAELEKGGKTEEAA